MGIRCRTALYTTARLVKYLFEDDGGPKKPANRITHFYDGFNTEETMSLLKFTLGPSWVVQQILDDDQFVITILNKDLIHQSLDILPNSMLLRTDDGFTIEYEDSEIPSERIVM